MSIYDLDVRGMRKTFKKFNETLYGRTVFFLAYFFPFLAFIAFIGFAVSCFIVPRTEVFIAFYISVFVFIISFLIGTAYFYREEDIKNPMFKTALEAFREVLARTNRKVLKEKSFNNSMEFIVSDPKNYKTLTSITTPTTIIYGELDQIIAHFNLPGILKENPEYISAIKTLGRHGVSRDKYSKIFEILKEALGHEAL